ncbi:hypothetical protein H312_02208 [Anncaliia algerae PRA339]|uniref:60S ribosome subunit biogenesis protein NIP7 n=1 Tax=Anncaliia algerae PRA339 TaxID=1288291 RepID=A0A059EZU2_9MICR|nr:hypothetical protein H312_02208 [Anncaliia algerae PRA339]
MRKLTEEEAEKVFTKLKRFIGDNIDKLLGEENEIVLHNSKVLLVSKKMLKLCPQIKREKLIQCGGQLGKFTKTNNFVILITALHLLSPYALHKFWVKTSAEMNFLYKNNIVRSHMHKISENVPTNGVVFVYNQNDTPLGFGITARSSEHISQSPGNTLVVINQADTGEYIRDETIL